MSDAMSDRGRSVASLGPGPYDLLIIGGGIVGAGVARDAASRGLKTLLVEQSDFASGTSSRSSRLLHGGLRYLAQGRVGLVREASVEKMRISKRALQPSDRITYILNRGKWHKRMGINKRALQPSDRITYMLSRGNSKRG